VITVESPPPVLRAPCSVSPSRWIRSARFDLAFFLAPSILAVVAVLTLPQFRSPELPGWAWLVFIVGIDVAHVWSSLYRTYFDPAEFARRRALYVGLPIACWAAGAILYGFGAHVFWRVMAYVAVWHFVRQQYGFVMLYRHRAGERGGAWIDKLAIYATMVYPLVFWHADGARVFAWFTPGDFVPLPRWTSTAAVAFYTVAIAVFVAQQIRTRSRNWGKIGVVASTAAVWYVGIVAFNSDFAFTITNVVAHGVPYVALVWLYGRRRWADDRGWRGAIHRPLAVPLFLGLVALLAYVEEGAWDVFVWQEHAGFFGGLTLPVDLPPALVALVVPLLILPQLTHYLLDAWIWKFDGSNPGLREHVFGEP